MKKAFDQTVRDIKRGVNKNVLKVPRIERKVLDATSNESWGPHGSVLAEIARASNNHYEYQMMMPILWRRLNDSGKNWRHVYKGLTVLEYLVANGSERVIGEIRARAYQISSLSDFQYIDSKGRDQGINVRRKCQSLIAIINDEEKIMEIREKASTNKDISSVGRRDSYSGSGGGYDGRHEDDFQRRDENRLGNGRGEERFREEDQNGRDHDGCNGLEKYKDDDYKGHNREDHNGYGLDNKNADEKGENCDREGAKADCSSQDERSLERKLSDQHIEQPPSYEEAVKNMSNSISDEGMDGGIPAMPVQSNASPPVCSGMTAEIPVLFIDEETDAFDDFDPRGPIPAATPVANNMEMDIFGSAAPTAANNVQMDLFGSLSIEESMNSMALVPATSVSVTSESSLPSNSELLSVFNKPNTNPFEDAPFHAIQQENSYLSLHNAIPSPSFEHNYESISSSKSQLSVFDTMEPSPNQEFGESIHFKTSNSSILNSQPTGTDLGFQSSDPADAQASYDILEGILPTNGPSSAFPPQNAMVVSSSSTFTDHSDFLTQPTVSMLVASSEMLPNHHGQSEELSQVTSQNNFNSSGLTKEPSSAFSPQNVVAVMVSDHGDFLVQPAVSMPVASLEILPNHHGQPQILPQVTSQSSLVSSGLTNEPSNAFHSQVDLSATPTSTNTEHPALPPLQALLPQNYSQPEISTQVAPQNTNGSSSALPVQAARTTVPFMTQIDNSDFLALPTASLPNPLNNPGRQEISPQVAPIQHLNSSALSLKVAGTDGLAGLGLQRASSPSFAPPATSQGAPSGASGPAEKSLQSNDKFETKSAVWANTMNLVNLDISGPKVNPLANIGVDFETLNRKEKREKGRSSATPASTVTMGRAMGTGSGIGRTAATGLPPPPNSTMGSGMGWGGGAGIGGGTFGGANMPMGTGMNMPMGMGMNMGMVQGQGTHPNAGMLASPAGLGVPGTGYNPMTSMNRYGSQPYRGTYS